MEDAPGYETPPILAASNLFDSNDLSGAYHTVLEEVSNDGYNNHYVIDSTFGEFVATGHETALVRIQEVRAIATLREMKKSKAIKQGFNQNFKNAALGPFKEVERIIRNPLHLVKVVPREVGRAIGLAGDVGVLLSRGLSPDAVKDFMGYYSAKRALAKRLGVDHNSPNEVLQVDLEDVAWSYYAGGVPFRVVDDFMPGLPIPEIAIGEGGGSVGGIVEMATDELTGKSTKSRLRRMKVPKSVRKEFLRHDAYSKRNRQVLARSLFYTKSAAGIPEFFYFINNVKNKDEAYRMQRVADMTASYHSLYDSVTELHASENHTIFLTEHGDVVVPLFYDYLSWTQSVAGLMRDTAKTVHEFQLASAPEIRISGRMTPRCRRESEALGFVVFEDSKELLEEPDGW
jgi:translation initiation factor 2 beta subunit (eIF-2beta)/eIF-5